jgi:hypothetical protein
MPIPAGLIEVILRMDLEPVDRRSMLEEFAVVDRPKANAETELRYVSRCVESCHWSDSVLGWWSYFANFFFAISPVIPPMSRQVPLATYVQSSGTLSAFA